MRVGLSTPVVTKVPGISDAWEDSAGPEQVAEIAETADRLGYHFLTCSEHAAVPEGVHSPQLPNGRGTRYWDPLATLSWLAGRTSRIRLATSVLVLGYHHPLQIAKRYGTLDLISGGRVVLGVGVGTVREEFEVLGADFGDRGPRADDAMRALRAALSVERPEYHGSHYDFAGLVVDPCARQDRVPLWVGGHSGRALRRAVTLGDGWVPGAPSPGQLKEMLARHPDRPDGFEVVVGAGRALDAVDHPGQVEESITRLADAGATIVTARPFGPSLDRYLEQLAAIAELSCFTALE